MSGRLIGSTSTQDQTQGQAVTPERTYAHGKRMFKERIAEIHANPASASPAEIAWLVDHIAAQQREIDGLLGLLIAPTHYPSEGLSKRWQLNWNGAEFRTEAEARAAVRAAWEGK